MEDAHATILKLDDHHWSQWSYFGVFDGHAGFRTAAVAAEKLHLQLVSSLNNLVSDHLPSNTVASINFSEIDSHQLEMTIKDAYFKFDNDWREDIRQHYPGREKTNKKGTIRIVQQTLTYS
jgi:serine/threonine protein phosphatase PrpC